MGTTITEHWAEVNHLTEQISCRFFDSTDKTTARYKHIQYTHLFSTVYYTYIHYVCTWISLSEQGTGGPAE
jgi:hypothetical protein